MLLLYSENMFVFHSNLQRQKIQTNKTNWLRHTPLQMSAYELLVLCVYGCVIWNKAIYTQQQNSYICCCKCVWVQLWSAYLWISSFTDKLNVQCICMWYPPSKSRNPDCPLILCPNKRCPSCEELKCDLIVLSAPCDVSYIWQISMKLRGTPTLASFTLCSKQQVPEELIPQLASNRYSNSCSKNTHASHCLFSSTLLFLVRQKYALLWWIEKRFNSADETYY